MLELTEVCPREHWETEKSQCLLSTSYCKAATLVRLGEWGSGRERK